MTTAYIEPDKNGSMIVVHCYGMSTVGSPEKVTYALRFPIDADQLEKFTQLQPGGLLNIPEGFRTLVNAGVFPKEKGVAAEELRHGMRLDQVSLIEIRNGDKTVVNFYVNGVSRYGDDDQVRGTNQLKYIASGNPKQWAEEDKKWITLEKAEKGWGVFEMSINVMEREWGMHPEMRKIVLGPTDKIVRLIGSDFMVVNPHNEMTAPVPGREARHQIA